MGVAAANLPVHHVDAAPAPAAAAAPVVVAEEAPAVVDAYTPVAEEKVMTPSVQYAYLPYAQNYEYYGAATPVVQAAAPVVPVAVASPEPSQDHAQDDFGQYSFGYSDGNSVKQEVKTADGVIRGAYSYVDSDGIVQTVNYIADGLGFRVGATNLPVHEVDAPAAAPVAVAAAPAVAPVAAAAPVAQVASPQVVQAYHPYASSYSYAAPVVQAAAPVVAAAPVAQAAAPVEAVAPAAVPVVAATVDAANNQFHAQDDYGQFNYGYSNGHSTKQELKTADGVTRGSYSYVDANGIIQTVNYLSDALGFRVAATNLPVHHVDAAPAAPAAAPAMDTNVAYAYLPYATNYGYNVAAPAA